MTYSVLVVVIDDDDPQALEEATKSVVSFDEVAIGLVDIETAETAMREAKEGYQG